MRIGEPRVREAGTRGRLRGVLLIVVVGIVLGVIWNALGLGNRAHFGLGIARPQAEARLDTLELSAVKRLYDADGALLVDARERSQYDEGHIAGAISLPYNGASADPDRIKRLDSGGRPYVVYCAGPSCELSTDLAQFLIESGKKRVSVFEGGYPEWEAAGYPIARGAAAGSRP